MCLAVPMRIVTIDGHRACCEARGIRREVSLTLLAAEDAVIGNHVLVHVGYAIQAISIAEAQASWDLFDEIAAELDAAEQMDHLARA
jgi:hydrogenase expression/formation protein HypC